MNWPELAALAERQHGLLTTAQVGSRNAVHWAVASGRLAVVRRGIYAVAGSPPSRWRDLAAALLAVDGVASHRAAAGLHRLAGIAPGAVEVTVFDMRTPRLVGVTAHRASVLYADDLTVVQGLPVTSAARTVVDLAPLVGPIMLQRLLDDCIVRRLCTADEVAECLDRSEARRGRRRLVPLLDARVRSESRLEQLWLRRLQRAGLAPPEVGFQLVVDRPAASGSRSTDGGLTPLGMPSTAIVLATWRRCGLGGPSSGSPRGRRLRGCSPPCAHSFATSARWDAHKWQLSARGWRR